MPAYNNTYDLFVAALECPVCGASSPADDSTNMQTYLRSPHTEGRRLAVGDRLALPPELFTQEELDGYAVVQVPLPGAPIHILHPWECPSCGAPMNWAEVVVRDEHIASINAVPLDRAHFERCHLISDEAAGVAMEHGGLSFEQLLATGLVSVLRAHL